MEKFSDGIASVAKQFLGPLFSIPYAGIRRISQGIDDKTDGKSIVANKLAQAAADELKNDPAAIAEAIELYAPGAIRKVQNTSAVLQSADEELKNDPEREYNDPDIDWLNSFQRYAEDASSDRMQRVMGKILAGEIKNNGSFSVAAVRTISEISPSTAQDFKDIYSEVIQGQILAEETYVGTLWEKLRNIANAGLLTLNKSALYPPDRLAAADNTQLKVKFVDWRIGEHSTYLILRLKYNSKFYIKVFSLTNVGIELGQLFDTPMPERSLRNIASKFSESAISISLYKDGREEVIK